MTPEFVRKHQRARLPIPALGMLALLLVGGATALVAGGGGESAQSSYRPIEHIARSAGCRVSEFDGRTNLNPPVSGRFSERDRAADGSYVGRRPPSLAAAIHALYHGRVLMQYRAGLPRRQVSKLDRLASADSDRVLLFANQTGMRSPVAAASYLSLMTCPRVDAGTLRALRVYRDRRRGFGQAF